MIQVRIDATRSGTERWALRFSHFVVSSANQDRVYHAPRITEMATPYASNECQVVHGSVATPRIWPRKPEDQEQGAGLRLAYVTRPSGVAVEVADARIEGTRLLARILLGRAERQGLDEDRGAGGVDQKRCDGDVVRHAGDASR